MKKMRLFSILSFLTMTVPVFSAALSAEERVLSIQSVVVDPERERVRLFWRREDGSAYGDIKTLLEEKGASGELRAVMNGGIYGVDFTPLGLYIENGKRLSPLELSDGEGNFFMKPNGVFALGEKGAFIVDAESFRDEPNITDAVQSGPLMMQDGVINQRFQKNSRSRRVRNAIGVSRSGKIVFLFSPEPVSFYEFAKYAQERLDIRDMLYLDGTLSQLYVAPQDPPRPGERFVSMIAIEKYQRSDAD